MGCVSYLHSNDLHTFGYYVLVSLEGLPDMTFAPGVHGRIPRYPWPCWDAYGHGIDRIVPTTLPFMHPGFGLRLVDPGVFRDGSFGRWQRRELWPAVMRGIYGEGCCYPYGGKGANVSYGSQGRRWYPPSARKHSGHGVRGLGGRRCELIGYGMRRARM